MKPDRAPLDVEPSQPAHLPPGTIVAQRYWVQRRVARTAMSAVYHARDLRTATVCIVKCLASTASGLPPEPARRAFHREAHILATLRGPFPTLLAFGREAFGWYCVQEYIPGVTLEEVLVAGRLSAERGLIIAEALIHALAEVHRQGFIYGDLHPRNVIVRPDSSVVLIDMGLARPIGTDPPELRGVGTPGYAPPEQAAGRPLDESADIYALGVVLSELLDEGWLSELTRLRLRTAQAPLSTERRVTLGDLCQAMRRDRAKLARSRHPTPTFSQHTVRAIRRRRVQEAVIVLTLAITCILMALLLIGLMLAPG